MFRNYSLRRNKIGGVGMLGGRLAPVFFYKGLSAASQLFKRPSDCLKDDDYYCTQRHGDTEFYFEHRTHKNKGIDADKQNYFPSVSDTLFMFTKVRSQNSPPFEGGARGG